MSKKHALMLYDCDRCMFTYKKKDLRRQRGMLLCSSCFDSVLEIEPVNVKWRSPRDNSSSLTPVTSPIIFAVGTAGITSLSRSQVKTREGVNKTYEMYIEGDGAATSITTIVAGVNETILTLIGSSDTYPVSLKSSSTLDIRDGGGTLYNESTMTLVYNATTGKWIETSRLNVLDYHEFNGPVVYNDDFAYNFDGPYIGV